jgi:antitoxin ParD1/3/4
MSAEVESLIQREYASGMYQSTDDLLVEAVLLLRDRNERLQGLRKAIVPSLERLDRGQGRPLDIESIKAEGRRRLDEEQSVHGGG